MNEPSVASERIQRLAGSLDAQLYPSSIVEQDNVLYCLLRVHGEKRLVVFTPQEGQSSPGFNGETGRTGDGWSYRLCPLSATNAVVLREQLPWLRPVPLGIQTSFGFGDRTGLATPGHVQSVRAAGIAPIFAQQSVRENTRIGRTPQQVMDDAMWGVFEEGWREPWGADADHVKDVESVVDFVTAGYTFFTIDPSDYVDNAAQSDDLATLRQKVANLPSEVLEASETDLHRFYLQKPFVLAGVTLEFDEERLLRAAAKYGRAIAHARTVNDAIASQMEGRPFDLEVSVDETDTPTSPYEHFFIVSELHRLAVPAVSIAPRFIGKFEKGVDYIGDIDLFTEALTQHVAVMQHFDDYKLSIHTGSDKFSIYPIVAQMADGRVHVKTAGTSYLEALRVVAQEDPDFFREILDFSRDHFEKDRKTYYLSCDPSKVQASNAYADADLPELLNQFDSRQVLHVTFGSVLDQYGDRLKTFLRAHEAAYTAVLVAHFHRHLSPFASLQPVQEGT